MAGSTNSIVARNVLRGRLSEDNLIAGGVGTAFNPAYALVDEAGNQIVLYINSSNYQFYAELKDKSGNHISNSNIIDLPLESMVVNGSYDATTKEVVLVLNNGNEVRFSVADLVEGLVSTEQLQEVLGDYVKFTDYASGGTAGVIKISNTYFAGVNSNGTLYALSKNYQQYLDGNDLGLISKGTLENVITGKELTNKTYVDTADAVFEEDLFGNETTNGNGENITLNNTTDKAPMKIDLYGNTSQETITGEIGTEVVNTSININDVNTTKEDYITLKGNTYQKTTIGKNLFDINIAHSNSLSNAGITATFNSDGTIIVNGTKNANYKAISYNITLPAGTYYFSGCPSGGNRDTFSAIIQTTNEVSSQIFDTGNGATFTLTEEKQISFHPVRVGTGAVTFNNAVFKPMIATVSVTYNDYEPYTGGNPAPNPSYPQSIQVVSGDNTINVFGKNLYSRDNGEYNVPVYATDGTSASYQDVNVVWIKVKPNTDYSFTLLPNSQTYFVRIIECTGDKGFIYRFPNNYQPGSGVANTLTITTQNNCEWLQIGINQYQTSQISQNNWEVMIEENATPSTYEPYQEQNYSVNLGTLELCKIGNYQDRIYKDNGKWYVNKQIGKVVLDGGETITTTAYSAGAYYHNITGINLGGTNNDYAMSNYYAYSSSYKNNTCKTADSGKDLVTRDNFDQSTYVTWLETNKPIFYYYLATPTYEEITDTTLLSQLNALYTAQIYNGTTNINTEANDLLPYIDLKYNVVTPSPSPDRPSDIQVVSGDNTIKVEGKNLYEYGDYNVNTSYYFVEKLLLNNFENNTTYTFSADINITRTPFDISIGYGNNYFQADGPLLSNQNNGRIDFTFTTNNSNYNNLYIRLPRYGTTGDVSGTVKNIQLKKGSTATPYQQYQSASYPINLPVENLFDKDNVNSLNAYIDGTTGTITSDSSNRTIYINASPNTTYTISKVASQRFRVGTYSTTPTINSTTSNYTANIIGTSTSITTGASDNYIAVWLYNSGVDTLTYQQIIDSLQIEKGSKVNQYTPYGTTPIELCKIGDYQDSIKKSSGNNYYKGLSFTRSSNNVDFTYNLDGSINANGTSTGNALSMVTSEATPYLITLSVGTYTISGGKSNIQIQLMDKNGNNLAETTTTTFYKNFTLNSETQVYVRLLMTTGKSAGNEKIYPMLNEGTTALPYEPYGKVWYLNKQIGKVVLNGSEPNWRKSGTYQGSFYGDPLPTGAISDYAYLYCNYFKRANINNSSQISSNYTRGTCFIEYGAYGTMDFWYDDGTATVDQWKTWLSNNNPIVYYPLKTPTNEEITDTTLLSQLEDLEKAKSYNEQTNVSQVNNDMPFEIAATAFIDSTAGKLAAASAQIDNLNEVDNNLSANKEDKSNKVATISASSTDIEYPTAKCVYDIIGDVESLLEALDIGSGV